jgi:hypothetical protein
MVMIKGKKTMSVVLACICFVLLVLVIIFAFSTYKHYKELKIHKEYFRQPNAPIQDWMTVSSVAEHYNITEDKIYAELNLSPNVFNKELGIDGSTTTDLLTIRKICTRKHLDCREVLDNLNGLRAK